MDRGKFFLGMGVAPLTLSLTGCGGDSGTDGDASHAPAYMFIQTAMSTRLADGKLTLEGVSPATVCFSDRPERIVGHGLTTEFVRVWGEGEDSFESDPPNAALSVVEGDDLQEVVLTIRSPRLEDGELTYDVDVLDGDSTLRGGASSLFIDVIGRPLTPISVAGTGRRVRRRHIRRWR